MLREIDYEKIDKNKLKNKYILVDLRSPKEYYEFTIPNSINIPIFENREREEIGYVYKQKSVDEAKELGVDIMSSKLPNFYRKVRELEKEHNTLIFFCERGGMRSTSIASLMDSLGIKSYKLADGYKGYRNYINKELPTVVEESEFIVIHGNTGVGKTDILKELELLGENIIDLEGYANHRGSFFGSLGLGKPRSQKMFDSLIYEKIKSTEKKVFFIEAESKRVGKVMIIDALVNKMKSGLHINVEATMDKRVSNILKEYSYDKDEVIEVLEKLRLYLSNDEVDICIELVEKNKYEEIVEFLMEKYYDPLYLKKSVEYKINFQNRNAKEVALEIAEYFGEQEEDILI